MKKFTYISIILLLLSFFSCSKEVKQEDIALQAAKAYYDQLAAGQYDTYIEGFIHGDSMPSDYRNQLLLNAKMYIEQLNDEHNGIARIEAVKAKCDTINANNQQIVTANALLALCFNDSIREVIAVPMLLKNQIWYLK